MLHTTDSNIDDFREIEYRHPTDMIIQQIRELIAGGRLTPGMKLPSERVLAERFRVGRGYIREALKKLEFYGVLQTRPKRGTVVASIGVKALEGLISNILHMDRNDFAALFETRAILEIHSAELAATRATEADIDLMVARQSDFERIVRAGGRALDEDHLFHLAIAEAAKNTVLGSLIGLITPDIIAMNRNVTDEADTSKRDTVAEHVRILDAIRNRDAAGARDAMALHMQQAGTRRFSDEQNTTTKGEASNE